MNTIDSRAGASGRSTMIDDEVDEDEVYKAKSLQRATYAIDGAGWMDGDARW